MTQNTKLSAALIIASAALALSAYAALRGSGATGDSRVCVDQEARDQNERLRRTLSERDAMMARLARAANAAPSPPAAATAPASPESSPPSQSAPPSEAELQPRRYTHFEVPNPSVTVTQKANGTYDIRTTDPKLKGTSLAIKAVTPSGDEDTLVIQIP